MVRTRTAKLLLLVPGILVSAYMAFWGCVMLGGFAIYLVVGTVSVVAAAAGAGISPGVCTACGGRRVLRVRRRTEAMQNVRSLRNQSMAALIR